MEEIKNVVIIDVHPVFKSTTGLINVCYRTVTKDDKDSPPHRRAARVMEVLGAIVHLPDDLVHMCDVLPAPLATRACGQDYGLTLARAAHIQKRKINEIDGPVDPSIEERRRRQNRRQRRAAK